MEKKLFLEDSGYTYVRLWECEKKKLEENIDMRNIIDHLEIMSPSEPRDAFFGGQTEDFKLYKKKGHRDRKIKYYYVTSLYPYVNETGKIPIGYPSQRIQRYQDV